MVKQRYNAIVVIKRSIGGTQDPTTKRLEGESTLTIYEGKADFQELSENDKLAFKNMDEGSAHFVEYKMWLPIFIHRSIEIDDTVEVEFNDGKKILCRINGKNRTSEAIHCNFIKDVN